MTYDGQMRKFQTNEHYSSFEGKTPSDSVRTFIPTSPYTSIFLFPTIKIYTSETDHLRKKEGRVLGQEYLKLTHHKQRC